MNDNSLPFRIAGSDGEPIHVTVHKASSTARATVVLLHGFKGFREWGFHPHLASELAANGYHAVRFDFSHNGIGEDSSTFERLDLFERNTWSRELFDLDCVTGALRRGELLPDVDPARFVVCGHSRGGGIAILFARRRGGYAALVTLAGIATVDRFSEEDKETMRREGRLLVPNARTKQLMPVGVATELDRVENATGFDIERAIAALNVPTLVVHGTNDESVPFAEAERLARAQPRARLVPIEGATHTFGIAHPFAGDHEHWQQVRQALFAFLDEHFGVLPKRLHAAPLEPPAAH